MNQPPTPPPAPAPVSSDDKIWIILCHLSLILSVGFVLPLIVYIVKKQDAPNTAEHAREALNFHISLLIYSIACLALTVILIGIPLFFVLAIGSIVLAIIASVKASEGVMYRYPLTIRFV